jgi:hypothetical protein
MKELDKSQAEQVTGALFKIKWPPIFKPPIKKPPVTTMMVGEEGGPIITTLALGEEGGGPIATTLAIGEEGGGTTVDATTGATTPLGTF